MSAPELTPADVDAYIDAQLAAGEQSTARDQLDAFYSWIGWTPNRRRNWKVHR
jgi:hypothetical protein